MEQLGMLVSFQYCRFGAPERFFVMGTCIFEICARGQLTFLVGFFVEAFRSLVAAPAICFQYRKFESMVTPRILASVFGVTISLLMDIGVTLDRVATLVKCTKVVFSVWKVAPLLLSHWVALSTILWMPL